MRVGGGSGTVIHTDGKKATILTCKHVVSKARTLPVTFSNGYKTTGTVGPADPVADLAVVTIEHRDAIRCIEIAEQGVAKEDTIFQIGYPGGKGPMFKKGKCTGFLLSKPVNMMMSFQIFPGDSGSGVFTADNKLCGVCWGGHDQRKEWLAVELQDIQRFCRGLGLKKPTPAPPSGPQKPPAYNPIFPQLPDKQAIAELAKKMKELGDGVGALRDGHGAALQEIKGHLEGVKEIKSKLSHLPEVADKIGRLGPFIGWLPWIAGGAASGGILPIALAGLGVGRWLLRRRHRKPVQAIGAPPPIDDSAIPRYAPQQPSSPWDHPDFRVPPPPIGSSMLEPSKPNPNGLGPLPPHMPPGYNAERTWTALTEFARRHPDYFWIPEAVRQIYKEPRHG